MDLRYYESQPNVPYAGLTDYYMKIQGVRMDVTQNGDGSLSVKNPKPNAVGATVDLSKGTISSENYSLFTSISFDGAESDPMIPIVKEGDGETLAKASPSVIDFGKYGIKGHADDSDEISGCPYRPSPTCSTAAPTITRTISATPSIPAT